MSKLTNKESLEKLAKALDSRSKALVKSSVAEEAARAKAEEVALQAAINGKAPLSHAHDDLYYTEDEIDKLVEDIRTKIDADILIETNRAVAAENALQTSIDSKANEEHGLHVPSKETANNAKFLRNDNTWATVTPANIGAAPTGHNHDDKYYTEAEIDAKVTTLNNAINGKASTVHNHNDLYYTETEVDVIVEGLQEEIDADILVEANRAKAEEAALQAAINGKANASHSHDDRYYTETEINNIFADLEVTLNEAFDELEDGYEAADIILQTAINGKSPLGHTHDDRYFTETEINNKLAGYSATGHNHDDKYYTETEIDAKVTTLQSNIDGKANKSHGNHVPTVETANNARFLRNDNTWATVTPANIGAAASSHGTHVTYASAVPLANGTAAIGSSGKVAREDHVHPLQTEVSGNAGSADVLSTPRNITIGNQTNAFDGSENITYTLSAIGASAEGHNHDGRYYTESEINTKVSSLQAEIDADVLVETNRAKAAEAALQASIDNKSNSGHTHSNLAIKLNGGTTEGTNLFTYNGGTAKTVNITPSGIGAAASSHNHDSRYYTETEIDSKITTINTAITTAKTDAQSYADQKIAALVDSAPDALNTLNELASAITDHQEIYDAYVVEMDSKLAGKSDTGHTHNYAGSSSAGGAATSANKVNQNLIVKLNSGATEGTNLFTFNGSTAKTINITPNGIGAANASHGTHVTYSTATPKANGTAAVGTSSDVARADHVHPLQTTVSGNAGSADKLSTARTIQIGNKSNTFDGTANITYTLSDIGAAESGHNHDSTYSKTNHTHNYAGSSSAGGVATSAAKLATPVTLTIGAKGKTFDGSANQSWSLSEIGAAASSHTHTVVNKTMITTPIYHASTGVLIDFNLNVKSGVMAIIKLYGNSYSANPPIEAIYQFYDYASGDIQQCTGSAISGPPITLKVYKADGKLKAWFQQPNNYCTFKLEVAYGNNSSTPNITLTNAAEPTTNITQTVTITPNRVYSAAYKPTPADIGAAASSHGTHVTWATAVPLANGTATIGSVNRVAREDHVHPLQTTISGNAATSSKWQNAITLQIGNSSQSLDGSKNVFYTLAQIGAAAASHGQHSVYGTCNTAAATAEKAVTISGSGFSLSAGQVISIKFTNSNSASSVKLNVNSTGAKPIWYNTAEYTGNSKDVCGYANRVTTYMYNGSHWVWISNGTDNNTSYTPMSLGFGYGTCNTAEATTAKVATLASYGLIKNGIVSIKFSYAVPASSTLNINSKGAKSIYFRNTAITANVIKAGDTATFIYDGSYYQLLSVDRWHNDIVNHTHNYAGSSSAGGAANSAVKLETARTLTIGNKGKSFDGTAGISWSLAEIGASPLQKSIVSKTVSNGTLTLSTDRYQYATLANGNTIALPSVSNFTEINLFVKDCNISTINLPDNCKWRVGPNLDSGDSFMFTFFYTGQEWLAEVKIYS